MTLPLRFAPLASLVLVGGVAMPAAVAQPPMEASAAEMVARADTDGDGKVSREEFIKARTAGLEQNFARMDTDGDGKLSREEFAAGMARLRELMQRAGPGRPGPRRPGGERGPEQGFRRPPTQE